MSRLDDKTLSLTPGQRIELYTLDLGIADGPVLRFTPNREDVTPATVFRMEDTYTSGIARWACDLTNSFDDGDTILISGYMRKPLGGAHFPAVSIQDTANGATGRVRFLLNLDTLADTLAQSRVFTTGHSAVLSQASEFVYFSIRATFISAAAVWISLWGAYGSPYPTQSNAEMGSTDIFGLRVFNRRDGLNIPVILPPFSEWIKSGQGTITEVPNTAEAVKVPVWQGHAYTPIPIKISGFEKSGNGPFPKPKMSMSNLTGAGSLLMQEYGDIRGADVTRTRLYADHLDNGIDPDPAAFYAPDVFTLTRRSYQDAQVIEFELSSKMDQQGITLPRRQLLRDVCQKKYRVWDQALNAGAGGFDYSHATCPYSGTAMFDMNGNAVTAGEEDKCSQTLRLGCRMRYGKAEVSPFGGFPMVGRFRQ